MGLGIKDVLGAISPVYGAVTGNGIFGNLLDKQSEEKAAKEKIAADEAQQKRAQAQAQGAAFVQGLPGMKKGGKVSSASRRADGAATKGKTRGKMI